MQGGGRDLVSTNGVLVNHLQLHQLQDLQGHFEDPVGANGVSKRGHQLMH